MRWHQRIGLSKKCDTLVRHKYLFLLFALSVLLASTQSAVAGSASGTLTVGLQWLRVVFSLLISPLALENYDPVDAHATSDLGRGKYYGHLFQRLYSIDRDGSWQQCAGHDSRDVE
jgi:hypothetical protein